MNKRLFIICIIVLNKIVLSLKWSSRGVSQNSSIAIVKLLCLMMNLSIVLFLHKTTWREYFVHSGTWDESDVCVLRFFLLLKMLPHREIKSKVDRNSQVGITIFWFFLHGYFCIRKHDVNILMQSCLSRVSDVCVLRFFLLFIM